MTSWCCSSVARPGCPAILPGYAAPEDSVCSGADESNLLIAWGCVNSAAGAGAANGGGNCRRSGVALISMIHSKDLARYLCQFSNRWFCSTSLVAVVATPTHQADPEGQHCQVGVPPMGNPRLIPFPAVTNCQTALLQEGSYRSCRNFHLAHALSTAIDSGSGYWSLDGCNSGNLSLSNSGSSSNWNTWH